MTKTVETTLGALPIDKLGDYIDAHEHFFMDSGAAIKEIPDFKLDNVDGAIRDVTDWKQAGGGAMVDTCPVGTGRNVRKCIQVSEATGIPIILASGFHKDLFYWPDHWRYSYSEDQMVELIAAECEIGVDLNEYKGPIVERSNVKAGTMKVAGLYNVVDPNMKKLIRVVGRVHQRTGTPVFAHTERGFEPFELIDLLTAVGVPPQCISICHMDRNPDLYLHKKIADRGVFLQYDTPSRFKYQPESRVVELMRQMIDAGFGGRLMLGGDFARRSYLKSYGGGPGYDYLLTWFTPRLLEEGFSKAELHAVWHDNPIRWLTSGAK